MMRVLDETGRWDLDDHSIYIIYHIYNIYNISYMYTISHVYNISYIIHDKKTTVHRNESQKMRNKSQFMIEVNENGRE